MLADSNHLPIDLTQRVQNNIVYIIHRGALLHPERLGTSGEDRAYYREQLPQRKRARKQRERALNSSYQTLFRMFGHIRLRDRATTGLVLVVTPPLLNPSYLH